LAFRFFGQTKASYPPGGRCGFKHQGLEIQVVASRQDMQTRRALTLRRNDATLHFADQSLSLTKYTQYTARHATRLRSSTALFRSEIKLGGRADLDKAVFRSR